MKCQLTSQEKLKDLRNERKLKLVEVAEATGISKSTIGNYESDDFKEQQISILTELANFYNVPLAYLIGLTDNREEADGVISDLHLDDETVEILKSRRINNRLLCEIIKHPAFANLMSDIEIYVDNLAGNWIHNLNRYVSYVRDKIKSRSNISDDDISMQTLANSLIDDDNYFGDLIESDIKAIAKDIRNDHKKDWDTGDEEQVTDKLFDQMDELIEEYKKEKASIEDIMEQEDFPKDDGMTTLEKAEVTRLSNIWDINFKKLSANEVQVLMYLVRKASKNPIFRQPTNGRRKR
ncbi:helix-turn-helix domain-containing protein [Pseudobutyrivibrio ruminis]|nr:helix-turn-helix transcriptional regulator [Pseudobutyrivibrio ruminis]